LDRNRDFGFAGFQVSGVRTKKQGGWKAGKLESLKARRLGSWEQGERQVTDDGRQMADKEA